mmetsp:Transcript_41931/g.64188  ORF Transcript_41931/g.64188 Transcript_41931/m.64188 type:complete len:140 (-) Transcript_41931:166-585(-)
MDFIGTLGGVTDILLQILGWVLGGYAVFHSTFATVAALYKVKSKSKIFKDSKANDPSRPDLQKMKLTLAQRIRVYLTRDFTFSPLCCCLKNKLQDEYNDILDVGCERMEEEMDIYNIIKKQRSLQFEINQLKETMGVDQ